MSKLFLILGSVLSGLSVVLGAFGAHGLKKIVSPEVVTTYQTGVQYQMYHALVILFIGLMAERYTSSLLHYAGFMFLGGIVLFSGSLYGIVSMQAMNRGVPSGLGIITPIGGLLFIVGWILLLLAVIKK